MFGMGWPEIAVIGIVGVLVFGPDKLPDFARQAGHMVRSVRRMAHDAKADLHREFGDVMGGALTAAELADVDPREVVRRSMEKPELTPGERPPFDPDAT